MKYMHRGWGQCSEALCMISFKSVQYALYIGLVPTRISSDDVSIDNANSIVTTELSFKLLVTARKEEFG